MLFLLLPKLQFSTFDPRTVEDVSVQQLYAALLGQIPYLLGGLISSSVQEITHRTSQHAVTGNFP